MIKCSHSVRNVFRPGREGQAAHYRGVSANSPGGTRECIVASNTPKVAAMEVYPWPARTV